MRRRAWILAPGIVTLPKTDEFCYKVRGVKVDNGKRYQKTRDVH